MTHKQIGLALLALAVIIGVVWKFFGENQTPPNPVKGFIGSEKAGFFEDDRVKKILAERYGITVDYIRAGSIEMVQENPQGYDFLFPSSEVAVEIFQSLNKKAVKIETIFYSPIVFYSWDIVTEALMKNSIVQLQERTYTLNFKKLLELIVQGKRWSEIGLPELYGRVTIIPTDPTKSNSGSMFAALVANMLNNGEVVNENTIGAVLPTLKKIFTLIGHMERSSGFLFEQYLTTGVGAKPIIVNYEQAIIEFSVDHQDVWDKVKNKIRILYPEPTVWSAHPLIALTPSGANLIKALQDKEIQKIAWERHGFRTGLIGTQDDAKILNLVGIPEKVTQVIPMPGAPVMDSILRSFGTNKP